MLDCLYTAVIMIYKFLGSKINAYYDHQFHTIRHSNCNENHTVSEFIKKTENIRVISGI